MSRPPASEYYIRVFSQWRSILPAALLLTRIAVAQPIVSGVEYLETPVERGELLLAELNCIACHPANEATTLRLAPRKAPNLEQVGNRLRRQDIEAFITSPRTFKVGTTMPAVLNTEEAKSDARAIAGFLSSLSSVERDNPPGDVKRGQSLYHNVGCVACHAPEPGYRPVGISDSLELAVTKRLSIPITLAKYYTRHALSEFLLDPLRVRPSGRMPSFKLTEKEAFDLTAYLLQDQHHRGGDPKGGSSVTVSKGQRAFIARNCSACHQLNTGHPPQHSTALRELNPGATSGCLSSSNEERRVNYAISSEQRKDIMAALDNLKTTKVNSNTDQIHHALSQMNCYACHIRKGIGGPEPARSMYFQTAISETVSLGDEGRIPPSLDRVGYKLTQSWLNRILDGSGEVRPYLSTRMPKFGYENVKHIAAAFSHADRIPEKSKLDLSGRPRHQRAFLGRHLMGVKGLSCITCHGLRGKQSLGVPAVDLADTSERLRPEWFMEYLLDPQRLRPRTLMPAFFLKGKSPIKTMMAGNDARKQIEQIWIYLQEIDQQPLPDGMADESFELIPDKAPIVFRTFMEHAGMEAIAVGFPAKVHVAFDAFHIRWALAWRGKFLDAESTWRDRFTPLTKTLGTDVKVLPSYSPFAFKKEDEPWPKTTSPSAEYTFNGYRLNKERIPSMLYSFKGIQIEDSIQPDKNARSLLRHVRLKGNIKHLWMKGLDGKEIPVTRNEIHETFRW